MAFTLPRGGTLWNLYVERDTSVNSEAPHKPQINKCMQKGSQVLLRSDWTYPEVATCLLRSSAQNKHNISRTDRMLQDCLPRVSVQ